MTAASLGVGLARQGKKTLIIDADSQHSLTVSLGIADEAMFRMAESIKEEGVHKPGIARPRPEGGYELLDGNRRKRACELVELATMPVIVRICVVRCFYRSSEGTFFTNSEGTFFTNSEGRIFH